MSSAVKLLPHYTYEDWINWKGQWELIDGIPYAMSPRPVPKHQRIAVALGAEFYYALKNCKDCTVYQLLDYKVKDDTILEPDLLIVCETIKKSYLDFPPALVVEILLPSTALKDRHSKFQIFEEQQVKYFVFVDPDNEEVEIYMMVDGVYELAQTGRDFAYDFSFDFGCTAKINFSEIW